METGGGALMANNAHSHTKFWELPNLAYNGILYFESLEMSVTLLYLQ